MPIIPIKVIRNDRKPLTVRMTRVLARLLGAYVPNVAQFGQIKRGATNVPMIVVTPNMWAGGELPDGGSALVWDIREDDEGDIKRKDKKVA